ncbi:MAG: hypothetical protein ABIF01_02075, partial [Candidatus Micrarchaeota archaeon]
LFTDLPGGAQYVAVETHLPVVELEVSPGSAPECYYLVANGTYIVDDISTTSTPIGSMQIIADDVAQSGTDYVDLLSSSTSQSSIITTPYSRICWRNDAAQQLTLETMAGIQNIAPGGQYCWNNPTRLGNFQINETVTGMVWYVSVEASDYTLPMFYQTSIFDPPTAIVRPNTDVCFRNNDSLSHMISLCRQLPNYTYLVPPCEEYCNATYPNFNWKWQRYSRYIGASPFCSQGNGDFVVNPFDCIFNPPTSPICTSCTVPAEFATWDDTYTFNIDGPPPNWAQLTADFDDCGWVRINGVLVLNDDHCPFNCNCLTTCGPAEPCDPPGFWVTGNIASFLHTGTNTIRIYTDDSKGAGGIQFNVRLTATRTYPTWSTILDPSETECVTLPMGVNYDSPICPDPTPPPPATGVYNFSDNRTLDKLSVNLTSATTCDTMPVYKIARKLNNYDGDVFKSFEFEILPAYNEHGPGWPALVTSEVGQTNANCICAQLRNITGECENCTTTFALDYSSPAANTPLANAVLGTCADQIDAVGLFVDGNAIATRLQAAYNLCDSDCNCNFTMFWEDISDFGAYLNHEFGKPSVILSFRPPRGGCWDAIGLGKLYKDMYGKPISHLAGAGIFGIAQTCLDERGLTGDCFTIYPNWGAALTGIGLINPAGNTKAEEFDNWFSGCGRYYYNSEGLTMEMFSANETNSTVCDSSRIMDLYNEYKCYAD